MKVSEMKIINGDYLELEGVSGVEEVMRELSRVLELPCDAWEQGPYPLLRLEGVAEVVVDYGPAGPASARVAIAAADEKDLAARRQVAERIYRDLAVTTPWALWWTSDDSIEPIAARPGSMDRHPPPGEHDHPEARETHPAS